jgi:glycosyltransferase involved in cell wall biosynthesis
MKILMLADVFFPDTVGGAGRVAYHLSHELSSKGHEVHILTRKTNGELTSYQNLDTNLFVHRFTSPKKDSLPLFFSEIKNSYDLAKRLTKKIPFDLVCAHQSLVATGPLFISHLKQIPFVYYFHSPWHEEFLVKNQGETGRVVKRVKAISFAMKWIEKRTLFKASKVIVLSDYMHNKIVGTYRFPRERIFKIPGGVETDRFSPQGRSNAQARQHIGSHQARTVFLTVRNLVPRMGIEALIKAFHQSRLLRKKSLLLIGGKGPLEGPLKSLAENFNLNGSVRFLGHIPDKDLPKTYQGADFFVLPTRKLEGFGLVILEAMASGTPVLGTPVGAIPETIGSFDKRLIFDGTHWQHIKKKLEELIEKPEEYCFDPKDCRKFVEDNFSWKGMADSFEKEAIGLVRY